MKRICIVGMLVFTMVFSMSGKAFQQESERTGQSVAVNQCLEEGFAHYQAGKYDLALAAYDKAIRLNPDYAGAYYSKGAIYHAQKKYEEAMQHYDKAIALQADYVKAYKARAHLCYQLKKFDEAKKDNDMLIAIEPDVAVHYYNRGIVYREQRKYNEAVDDYNKAISLKAGYIDAYANRAFAYLNLHKESKAAADINKVLMRCDDGPIRGAVYFLQGQIYQNQKKFQHAIKMFDKAIEENPNIVEQAKFQRGKCYFQLKEYDRVLEDFDEVIRLNPKFIDAYLERAIVHFEQGRHSDVIANCDKVIAARPNDAVALALKGVSSQLVGDK